MTTLATCVFLGTIYPLIIDGLTNDKISVGPPYFNQMSGFIILPLLATMMTVPMLQWQRTQWRVALPQLKMAAGLFFLLAIVFMQLQHNVLTLAHVVRILAIGLLLMTLIDYGKKFFIHRRNLLSTQHAMPIAHSAFALMIIASVSASIDQREKIQFQHIGETITIADWQATLLSVTEQQEHNYLSQKAVMRFTNGQQPPIVLQPEKRFYPASRTTTTEAAIHTTLRGDLYAVFDTPPPEHQQEGRWTTRFWFKPYVIWIWLSGALMTLAALIALMTSKRV